MNGEYYYAINGSIQYMESAADFDRKPRSDNVALLPRTSSKMIADEESNFGQLFTGVWIEAEACA